jgi:hypothetical protein
LRGARDGVDGMEAPTLALRETALRALTATLRNR